MKKKLFSNWGLKLVSLLLAFVMWLVVINIEDPPDNKEFRNIPVTLVNTDMLTDTNRVYEILEGSDKVSRVKIKAKKSVIVELSESDIVAIADVENVTQANTIQIEFSVPEYDVSEIEVVDGSKVVKLAVEEKKTKNIPLTVTTKGEVAEGYQLAGAEPRQNRITISGAESKVDRVSYAMATVDITDATSELSTSESIELFDEEGNRIEDTSIWKNMNTVGVTVQVLATKYVPISYTVMGAPADGYRATGVVESNPESVRIVGEEALLKGINEIVIPEEQLNITGQTENLLLVYNIKEFLPEGTALAEGSFNGSVSVTVYIEKEVQKKLSIPAANIRVINLPQGLHMENVDDKELYDLRVTGLNGDISLLQEGTVRGTVDIAAWMTEQGIQELAPGTYYLPVSFELGENITVNQPVTLGIAVTRDEGSDVSAG